MCSNKSPPPPISILRGHNGAVTALHFTNDVDEAVTDKPSLISGSDLGEIFIWSMKTKRTYHRFEGHHGKMILYLHYYKNSLISQGRDGYINEWKYADRKWTVIRSFNSSSLEFCASCFFPTVEQIYLVTPTREKSSSMTFYNYETAEVLKAIENRKTENQCASEMCMCMKVFMIETKIYLLMGHDSGFLSLWNYESSKVISRLKCHPEVILCLDYDFKYRNCGISGSVDDSLQIWKIDENEQLVKKSSIKITNPSVNAVKIRSDGKIVITAGQDKSIRIFSWKTLKPLAVLTWHRAPVSTLALNPEPFEKYNLIFASGSKDKNICLLSIY